MSPLREPDPDLSGFQLPPHDAARAMWEDAFTRLNSLQLELDQIERGYALAFSTDAARQYGQPDILALRQFCVSEGILPADVGAEAILVRWSPVADAMFNGVDVMEGDPPYFIRALRELRVEDDVLQFIGAGQFKV